VLTPAYIEGSTISNRQQIADDLRRVTGQPTAGDRQGQQQNEVAQKAQQAQASELQARGAMAQVAKTEAEAERAQAQAQKDRANAALMIEQAQVVAPVMPAMPAANEDDLIQEALAQASA
jgi:multidrug resistance efflux pump